MFGRRGDINWEGFDLSLLEIDRRVVFLKKLNNIEELENMAKKVRRGIIEEVYEAQSGHPGGALSVADILTY